MLTLQVTWDDEENLSHPNNLFFSNVINIKIKSNLSTVDKDPDLHKDILDDKLTLCTQVQHTRFVNGKKNFNDST